MFRFVVFLFVLSILAGAYPALLLIRSTHSEVGIDPAPKTIGLSTPLTIRVTNPHGFREVAIWLEQDGAREKLFEVSRPAHRWGWAIQEPERRSISANVAAKKDGKAKLTVEAQSND